MTWEDRDAFNQFCGAIVTDYRPEGVIETQLAQSIAEDHWRLNRVRAIENNIFAPGLANACRTSIPTIRRSTKLGLIPRSARSTPTVFSGRSAAFRNARPLNARQDPRIVAEGDPEGFGLRGRGSCAGQPFATIQSLAFADVGGGRLSLNLAGRLRIPGQQVASILEQLRHLP